MKPDERELLRRMQAEGHISYWEPEEGGVCRQGKSPRDLGAELGMHWKRVAYLCRKWDDKGWFQCSVCDDLGWLTKAGTEVKLTVEGEQTVVMSPPMQGGKEWLGPLMAAPPTEGE